MDLDSLVEEVPDLEVGLELVEGQNLEEVDQALGLAVVDLDLEVLEMVEVDQQMKLVVFPILAVAAHVAVVVL